MHKRFDSLQISVIAVTVFMSILLLAAGTLGPIGCGRTSSRFLGKDARQTLGVENLANTNDIVSVSFDKRGSSTVKDVTYKASDGYVYTQEFKDISPFGGVIRWVPAGQGSSLIQSRAISRWTGGAVNLELPEGCSKILNVDIGYDSKNERTKNVVCLMVDNKVLAREYREGLFNRHLEGWLEVKGK